MGSSIDVEDVTVQYKSFAAVTGARFTVPLGQTLVLLGPSGCGKSSLLNAIAGFVPISGGRVLVGGDDVTHAPPQQRRMSMVFQTHALFPHLTVLDNVTFGLRVSGRRHIGGAERRRRALEALEIVRLGGMEDRYPESLSGGERQRVALARAMTVQPDVMLLDEPLSSLDARLREELRLELRKIAVEQALTMIYVTHDQDEAFALGDEIAVIRKGVIQQRCRPEDIYENPRTPFVASFVGGSNLIPCRVVESASDSLATVEAVGRRFRCRNPWQLEAGSEVSIALREHQVRLGLGAAATGLGNSLPGTVEVVRYMGSGTVVAVRVTDDVLVKVRVPSEEAQAVAQKIGAGDEVAVEWRAEDSILVREQS